MRAFFRLDQYKTTFSKEVLCGITTFLTMSYILFANPAIASEAGMPLRGVFTATAITAIIGTLLMAFFANVPYAMAPGMGFNTFIIYTICISLQFHWKEALALCFITGVLFFLLTISKFRKVFVMAIPKSLKYASSAGIGMFITYIGLKNAGFLSFTANPGHYITTTGNMIISDSSIIPSFVSHMTWAHLVSFIGLITIIFLLTLEIKTGEKYAVFLVGIITATFIGIPLNVTNTSGIRFFDLSAVSGLKEVCFSFFGNPGLGSLFNNPIKALTAVSMILTLLLTNITDTVGTIIGIGQFKWSPMFDEQDMNNFETKEGISSKLDRTLVISSTGGIVASLFGTTTSTTYLESVTGIIAGGKTGLTSLVIGLLFLICLPFEGFFSMIPSAAVAPAIIVAGLYMFSLLNDINWGSYEEAVPAGLTVLMVPITYSILDGIAAGYIAHIVIQIAQGNARKVHPFIYIVSFTFILIKVFNSFLYF